LASRGAGTGEGAGSFRFEAKGLRHGRRALCRAVLRRPAVVVVDEIGPLELSGRGWRRAVDRLVPIYRRYRTRLLVLVVRERLVEAVRREWRLGPCAPPGPQRRRQP
jgi:nucleoside-triphosphatase THEP1